MSWWEALVVVAVGMFAGTINTVVGSGTLITFPVLVALGYPPVTATTSNSIGLAPGTISGAIGYRRELDGQRDRVLRFGVCSLLGAIGGTALLLSLPPEAFEAIVPVLIALALVLVVFQPWLSRWLSGRERRHNERGGPLLLLMIFLTGVYGGYFTAAQGVLLMAFMGLALEESVQRLNAMKNVLSAIVNVAAGTIYALIAPISWPVVGLLALGSVIGGQLGATIGRKLPSRVLRGVIVVIGAAAIVQFLLN